MTFSITHDMIASLCDHLDSDQSKTVTPGDTLKIGSAEYFVPFVFDSDSFTQLQNIVMGLNGFSDSQGGPFDLAIQESASYCEDNYQTRKAYLNVTDHRTHKSTRYDVGDRNVICNPYLSGDKNDDAKNRWQPTKEKTKENGR